jgi:hypothetical protein
MTSLDKGNAIQDLSDDQAHSLTGDPAKVLTRKFADFLALPVPAATAAMKSLLSDHGIWPNVSCACSRQLARDEQVDQTSACAGMVPHAYKPTTA